MGRPTYVRSSGPHVAERVQPAVDSEDAQRFAALAGDPSSGWRVEDEPEPASTDGRPPRVADKAAWVAYADSQDPADHTGLTRQQLIEQYGKGGEV